MEIDLAVLADAATVDPSGKLNILGIFDRIGVREFPARHRRVALVLRFSAGGNEAGEHKVGIGLRSPSGEDLVRVNGNARMGGKRAGRPANAMKVPQVLNLENLVFKEAGLHHFDVEVDGEHQVSIPLTIEGPPERSEQQGPAPGPAVGGGPTTMRPAEA